MKLVKGRKYIMCGNFPAPEALAQELKDKLDVEVLVFLSNTDNVSVIEYVDKVPKKKGWFN